MKGTNLLKGIQCPKCKQNARFHIVATAMFTNVMDDGTGMYESVEWCRESQIVCPLCNHTGTVGDFTEPATPVVFRKYPNGEIIALFPTIHMLGEACQSFLHVGQHGSANYGLTMRKTKPTNEEEYADLKKELESGPYGYNFKVCLKRPHRKVQE